MCLTVCTNPDVCGGECPLTLAPSWGCGPSAVRGCCLHTHHFPLYTGISFLCTLSQFILVCTIHQVLPSARCGKLFLGIASMHDIGWFYSHFTLTLRSMEAASLGAGLGCHLHGSYFWLFSSPKENDRPCSKSVIERTKMKRNLTNMCKIFCYLFLSYK